VTLEQYDRTYIGMFFLFCSRQPVVAAEHHTVFPMGSELTHMMRSDVTTLVTQEYGQFVLQEVIY